MFQRKIEFIIRSRMDISLDEIRDRLWTAVRESKGDDAYVREVFASYLIYELGDKYHKIGYSLLDGEVQLGSEETPVERQWVEARSAQDDHDDGFSTTLRLEGAQDATGKIWDVTICEPGFTLNGWYLDDDVLRDAAGLFEGVDVNHYEFNGVSTHVPDQFFDAKKYLVRNKAGWIENVRHVAGQGLKGVLHFLDNFQDLGKTLMESIAAGKPAYGLSYDCPVRARQDVVDGKKVWRAVKFIAADSVDIVTSPAAKGRFDRSVGDVGGTVLNKQELFALIQEKRPDLVRGKACDDLSDEDVVKLARMAMDQPAGAGGQTGGDQVAADEIKKLRCEMALKSELEKADLPEISKNRIAAAFKDRVFESDELQRAIADEKDYLAKIEDSRKQSGDSVPAGTAARVGLGSLQRIQMAMDRAFGLTEDDLKGFVGYTKLSGAELFPELRSIQDIGEFSTIPRISGIGEFYALLTGDPEVSGRFNPNNISLDIRASADITSATFSYALGNTMYRRLIKDYRTVNYRENLLISNRRPASNFKQQEAIKVGYFGDLSTVDPETGDYAEIAGVTDEDAKYSVGQKGNTLTITRKTIKNDDLNLIARLVSRLGRAARRTFAKFVWGLVISNTNCADETAFFTSPHGNLLTSALSFSSALTAYIALANRTEQDSGEKIAWMDDDSIKPVLVYPTALMETGEMIVNDAEYFSTNDLTDKKRNPLKGKITGAQLSLLTDPSDWYMFMPASEVDIAEIAFMDGNEEPEMFVSDLPGADQVFNADKIRHKIRHEYGGTLIDPNGGIKSTVAD